MTTHFALDRSNRKLLGVCAGVANYTGIDPLGVRLIAVALTLFLLGPVAIMLYVVTALIAANG